MSLYNPRDYYYIYDLPVPYKMDEEKELKIYPATMKDYLEFHTYATCFLLEKNSIADPRVISMSNLEYLYSVSTEENKFIYMFDALMRLVLRNPKMEFRPFIQENGIKAGFAINGRIYDFSDFDNLREIISEQNLFELPDISIPKDIRDKMDEARRIKESINNRKMASLEDQIIA